ncbi:MAG: NAD(P)H-dependent oxidoreductase subunit E [Parcubacteria group bacterium]
MTVEKILLGFDPESNNILPVLKKISAVFGFVGEEEAQKVANYFQVPLTRIFEAASFYDLIRIKKKAPLEIKVCSGANCATKSVYRVIAEIEGQLGIKAGDQFNPNVELRVISCLGQCGQGPVVIVNEAVFLRVTPRKIKDILRDYL